MKFDPGTDPASAAALAKSSQVAIVFAVQHESEGMDLKDLSLPDNQDALIEAVAAANPHTIVVLETGGAVKMPWIDKVSAVIEAWYPGIRGSEAIANVLFGERESFGEASAYVSEERSGSAAPCARGSAEVGCQPSGAASSGIPGARLACS